MKEPDMERVATDHGPESCGGVREGAAEALTGGSAGQPLSSEITSPGRRPCVMKGKARRRVALTASHAAGPAESETLSMRGHFMHENREIPCTPAACGWAGRPEKGTTRTFGVYVHGKSDKPIVPLKPPNKGGRIARWRRRWREGV